MAQAMPDVREEILKLGGIRPIIAAMNNYPQEPPAPGGFCEDGGRVGDFWDGKSKGKPVRCYGMSSWIMVVRTYILLSNFSL